MPPLPAPFSTGASAENQPKPGHVAVNIPCAVAVRDGATAATGPPRRRPHHPSHDGGAGARRHHGEGAGEGPWVACMALAVPALILL